MSSPLPRWLFLLGIPLGALATSAPWQAAAGLDFNRAHQLFADAPPSREHALGTATTLLNIQPKTPGNIITATRQLEALRATSAQDEVGITATYLLGRIAQLHQQPADPARALALYGELAQAHPDHPLAQLALVKTALIRLYEPVPRDALPARFLALETLAPRIPDPSIRFQYHQVMREAYGRLLGDYAAMLRHTEAQLPLPAPRPIRRADTLLLAATCAQRLGQNSAALDYYARFLAEFPRESRSAEVALRHRELAATTP